MSAVAFDLAKLVEKHGSMAVLLALRNACHGASDHQSGAPDASRWQEAGKAIGLAAHEIQFDLAKLVEKHGSMAVLLALRNACHGASDHQSGAPDASRWQEAGKAIGLAAHEIQKAESVKDGVTLEMSLTVLADLSEDA